MNRCKLRVFLFALGLGWLIGCSGGSSAAPPAMPASLVLIGQQGYLYGYALVLMEETQRDQIVGVGVNRFINARTFPPPTYHGIVAPNADTLYSAAWLDLRNQAIVMHVPDTHGRYYLMPMLDAWSEVFASPGKRTTGTGAGDFAITGPNWHGNVPPGLSQIKSPTSTVWILGRIETNGPADYPAVNALQDQLSLTPLNPSAKPALQKSASGSGVPPPGRVAQMSVAQFFNELAQSMADNPPHPGDAPIVAQLASIGVRPGMPFNFSGLSASQQGQLQAGVDAARQQIADYPNHPAGKNVNGWLWNTNVGTYGTDYARRAYIAAYGLGANLPQDAIYPTTSTDASGAKLNGAAKNYVIHFPAGQTPPVNGFWSITLYTPDLYFYPNDLGRQAVGSLTGLVPNSDGSLDIFLSHTTPGPGKESNWLPAPAGAFVLMLRLYWPQQPAIDATYNMPAPTSSALR